MKKEDFFEVLGELDDDIVSGAKAPIQKKLNWNIWGTVAACLCLAAAAAAVFFHLQGMRSSASTPMGQGYFNAIVIDIADDAILVECIKNFYGDIPVGAEVEVSLNTLSTEEIPPLQIEDHIRVLYMGANTDTSPVTLKDTISIFLLDKNGVPVISSTRLRKAEGFLTQRGRGTQSGPPPCIVWRGFLFLRKPYYFSARARAAWKSF